MSILNLFAGYKTYLAAAGLVGLSVYQVSEGQFAQAAQSFLGALAAVGLHSAIVKSARVRPTIDVDASRL